jgi:hypothetical protein
MPMNPHDYAMERSGELHRLGRFKLNLRSMVSLSYLIMHSSCPYLPHLSPWLEATRALYHTVTAQHVNRTLDHAMPTQFATSTPPPRVYIRQDETRVMFKSRRSYLTKTRNVVTT